MTDAIIGWRKWLADPELGVLRSVYKIQDWAPREKLCASCMIRSGNVIEGGSRPPCRLAPSMACSCGIYAVNTHNDLSRAGGNASALVAPGVQAAQRVDVIGQVSLWGRILDCPHGWRSEFAYPYELFVVPPVTADPAREEEAITVAKAVARKLRSNYLVDSWVIS